MLTLMPRSRKNDPYLRILSDDLITVPVSAILANLKKQDITIHLPKFNIENNLDLVPTLRHVCNIVHEFIFNGKQSILY